PPLWAVLRNETNSQPRVPALRKPPDLLRLEENSCCNCRDGGSAPYDPDRPKFVRQATLYTTIEAYTVDIELQICSRCPPTSRKHIEPDPRNIGVFNYNNTRLFTHELISEYISAFTSSETPIDPWIVQITRRYQEMAYGKPNHIPFVGGELFRAAWFSCVRLMDLEPKHSDFKGCPLCKEMPKNLICDGVSIAFGQNQVNSNLQPLTAVSLDLPRHSSKPSQKKEWIADAVQRKQLQDWLQ
ncbi:hypothetical protein GYMLUDRAFT_116913, partial [Collybiopsis luxurians FD-317 M1]